MKLKYCVYLTIYTGNKLPPFYLGSSCTGTVQNGYRGSAGSAKYKEIWQKELQDSPQHFKTKIVKYCNTRKEAYKIEREWLKKMKCAENDLFINQPRANLSNGLKGAAKLRGKSWEEILGKEESAKRKEANKEAAKERWQNPEYIKRVSEAASNNWKDPVLAERMKKRTNVEGYRAAALKRWGDPATREKMRQSMKGKKKSKKNIP